MEVLNITTFLKLQSWRSSLSERSPTEPVWDVEMYNVKSILSGRVSWACSNKAAKKVQLYTSWHFYCFLLSREMKNETNGLKEPVTQTRSQCLRLFFGPCGGRVNPGLLKVWNEANKGPTFLIIIIHTKPGLKNGVLNAGVDKSVTLALRRRACLLFIFYFKIVW